VSNPDHECPDCGNVHKIDASERIRRLEAEVERLKAHHGCGHRCHCNPYYYSTTYWPTIYNWPTTGSGTTRDLRYTTGLQTSDASDNQW
jgi:hypothetical protein